MLGFDVNETLPVRSIVSLTSLVAATKNEMLMLMMAPLSMPMAMPMLTPTFTLKLMLLLAGEVKTLRPHHMSIIGGGFTR